MSEFTAPNTGWYQFGDPVPEDTEPVIVELVSEPEPGPGLLWKQAGGGTPEYSRQKYLDLMHEHGYLLGDDGYDEAPRNLPCGWPGRA